MMIMQELNTYTFSSMITGYHVYKDMLVPTIDKQLSCCQNLPNIHGVYAVAVVDSSVAIVDHACATYNTTSLLCIHY